MLIKNLIYTIHYYDSDKNFNNSIENPVVPDNIDEFLSLENIADMLLLNMLNNGFTLYFNDSTYLKYDQDKGLLSSVKPIKIHNKDLKDVGEVSFSLQVFRPFYKNEFSFKIMETASSYKEKNMKKSIQQINEEIK